MRERSFRLRAEPPLIERKSGEPLFLVYWKYDSISIRGKRVFRETAGAGASC